MQRREFVKFCAASATAARVPAVAAADATPTFYGRVKLIAGNGAPLKAAAVPAERNLIFHYPFAATPCFLLNLGHPAKTSARLATADKRAYEWKGGVGPRRSIVAYSAICAHQLAYPTREISFISYRVEKSARNRLGNVIHCCAEHSQYDPADGARSESHGLRELARSHELVYGRTRQRGPASIEGASAGLSLVTCRRLLGASGARLSDI